MIYQNIRCNHKGVSPVIAVILMVAITVVMSGLLWAMLQINTAEPKAVNISASHIEKENSWKFSITAVSKNNLYIEDLQFRVVDKDGALLYQIRSFNVNPPIFQKGLSTIYAITLNATVLDSSTNNPVNVNSSISDYINCYVTYIDTDSDGKVNEADTIYLFKDYDNDGTNDILPIYKFQILIDNEMAFEAKV